MHRDGRGRCASTPGDRGDVLRDTEWSSVVRRYLRRRAVALQDQLQIKGARCHFIALRGLVVGTVKEIGHEAQLNGVFRFTSSTARSQSGGDKCSCFRFSRARRGQIPGKECPRGGNQLGAKLPPYTSHPRRVLLTSDCTMYAASTEQHAVDVPSSSTHQP